MAQFAPYPEFWTGGMKSLIRICVLAHQLVVQTGNPIWIDVDESARIDQRIHNTPVFSWYWALSRLALLTPFLSCSAPVRLLHLLGVQLSHVHGLCLFRVGQLFEGLRSLLVALVLIAAHGKSSR